MSAELYKNPALSPAERAKDLLSRMTAEEKIFQISAQILFDYDKEYREKRDFRQGHYRNPGHFMHRDPSAVVPHSAVAQAINEDVRKSMEASRFCIPVLENGEALHGAQWGMATCFPQPIAMAASFDLPLVEEIADIIGKECAAVGVRQVFAPVVNIARDCRWGRTMETFGEDILLSCDMGVAICRGLQKNGVIATPKHFVDNYSDGGRDSNYSHTSERTLREVYLEPFRRCVRDGGAGSIMAAYNGIDGLPCSCNKNLLDRILRKEWGFDGFVVSDYSGVGGISGVHQITGSQIDGHALALKAGLDVTLPRVTHEKWLEALNQGKITEEDLDRAVLRVLTAKFALGLFDNPYVDEAAADRIVRCEEHRAVALKAAREAVVLLKNDGILPLDKKKIKRIGVFGEGANLVPIGQNYSGPYGGWRAADAQTPLQSLQSFLGPRVEILTGKDTDIPALAPECDVCLYFTLIAEGEGRDRCNISLSKDGSSHFARAAGGFIVDDRAANPVTDGESAIRALLAANPQTVVVLLNGAPIDVSGWVEQVGALLEAWYPGEMGAQAITEILFGECNPSGKLPISFPRSVGQLPLYYSHKTSGRGYHYNENDGSPLFEFGFGLGYSPFTLTDISPVLTDSLSVELTLRNEGKHDGAEVVQVYLQGRNCGVMRPVAELKGYGRFELKAGEKRRISLSLDPEAFHFYNADMEYGMHDSDYTLSVGTSCKKIAQTFELSVRNGKIILK